MDHLALIFCLQVFSIVIIDFDDGHTSFVRQSSEKPSIVSVC
jgi:hypothetical protein